MKRKWLHAEILPTGLLWGGSKAKEKGSDCVKRWLFNDNNNCCFVSPPLLHCYATVVPLSSEPCTHLLESKSLSLSHLQRLRSLTLSMTTCCWLWEERWRNIIHVLTDIVCILSLVWSWRLRTPYLGLAMRWNNLTHDGNRMRMFFQSVVVVSSHSDNLSGRFRGVPFCSPRCFVWPGHICGGWWWWWWSLTRSHCQCRGLGSGCLV